LINKRVVLLLWKRLDTFQDTHDQESNSSSPTLVKLGFQLCTG
jgi:hypothetical protein